MFEELPRPALGAAPRSVQALRWVGFGAVLLTVLAAIRGRPPAGLHGDGPWIILALVAFLAGLPWLLPRERLRPGQRLAGATLVAAASLVLMALQPKGAALSGIYIAVVISALRLPDRLAVPFAVVVVAATIAVIETTVAGPGGAIASFLPSIIPWFIVIRLLRGVQEGRARAEGLVTELRDSRAAYADAAAEAERARVARDMHDVLAHSLSALALQLEATRLLARDRRADPAVVAGVERAHRLAADGLEEARRAVAALRGDALPGPERLRALADTFAAHREAEVSLRVTGTPRTLSADARVTLYRAAQEALTNVARHAAAERVEITLAYEPDRVVLVVSDHGPGAPVLAGADGERPGGGYGLTGMRERAELLGGRLEAGPTPDGFRVRLCVPA